MSKPNKSEMFPLIPEAVLEGWLDQWPKPALPERRAPKCWGCGRTIKMAEVWHVFFRKNEREAHVCDTCAEPYMTGPICTLRGDRLEWHIRPTVAQMQKVIDKIAKGLWS